MTVAKSPAAMDALVPSGELSTRYASIIRDYLVGMAYQNPTINASEGLEASMHAEMKARNMCCSNLEKILHLCANYAEFCYPYHTFEEKKTLALYVWYVTYIDDMVANDGTSVTAFQERFYRRQPQSDPVLDALSDIFLKFYDMNDPLSSNLIITCTLEFLTSSVIEPQTGAVQLVRDAWRFPWFMRERTGFGESWAHLVFPKRLGVNLMDYIEAVPDMTFWIDITNDILSFYKEEVAGETDNLVHLRATYENKEPMEVVSEMKDELIASQKIIYATLAAYPVALHMWKSFQQGFIYWHLSQDRYKLQDLGL